MDKNFWLRRWHKNEIGFHMTDPHHLLQKFFSLLRVQSAENIFVPLCGKSPDLRWLRDSNLNVLGVELSRTAVEAFFRENNLCGEWDSRGELPCCCAEGYKIYCGDFFKLTSVELENVHACYDRGSLVALPPEMRTQYAAQLAALLPAGSRTLVISYRYNQSETAGPPFSVSLNELESLFRDHFQVEFLSEEDVLWSHQGLVARGVTELTEYAVLLTRK